MHTPGPWTAFEKDGKHVQADEWSTDCEGARSSTHAPIKAGSQVVALVVASARHWPDLPDIAPNCHLIAAAPELLAALQAARIYVRDAYECAFPNEAENDAVLRDIDAAIVKAKGGAA